MPGAGMLLSEKILYTYIGTRYNKNSLLLNASWSFISSYGIPVNSA